MIIRPRPHWLHLLFVRRGSLIGRIVPQLLFTTTLAVGVVFAHGTLFEWKVTLTAAPFSLMGVALAIFLGFRINASYDRFWEARKLWGGVLVETRNLARQVLALAHDGRDARPFILGLAGFAAAMRNQLRRQDHGLDLGHLLPEAVVARSRTVRYPASMVLLWLSETLHRSGTFVEAERVRLVPIEQSLDRLSGSLGGCERIAITPLPFTYSVILHRSSYLYCMLLPFGLVDTIGLATPIIVAFMSYTFFALESLSNEIEEPFGSGLNALALNAMVREIEANMRELLGEVPPERLEPDANFMLT